MPIALDPSNGSAPPARADKLPLDSIPLENLAMLQRVRSAVDRSPVMARWSDASGNCLYVNRLWLQYTGRASAHEEGRGWIEAIDPEGREAYAEAYAEAWVKRCKTHIDYLLRRHDGVYRWIRDCLAPTEADAGRYGCMVACVDVHELKQIAAQEQSARAEAEAVVQSRDRLLAIVSHELRSPLNGIQSWTYVLERQLDKQNPALERALAGILTGVTQQVRLIDELLDATRAISGRLRLDSRPMTVRPVIEEAIEGLRPFAAARGLEIITEYGIDQEQIEGDPQRVEQVIRHIVSHAVKSSSPDERVHVSAALKEGTVSITVSDNGRSLDAESLAHVFDPFGRPQDEGSQRAYPGLGLGLALARHLVQLHGGQLTAESAGENGGTTFHISLPLREAMRVL